MNQHLEAWLSPRLGIATSTLDSDFQSSRRRVLLSSSMQLGGAKGEYEYPKVPTLLQEQFV